jgi:hypothetical protein
VTATTTAITSGGIGFRSIGHNKYWDTVTDTPAVNNFTAPAPTGPGAGVGPSVFDQAGFLPNVQQATSADTAAVATALAPVGASSTGPAHVVAPSVLTASTTSGAVVPSVVTSASVSAPTLLLGADSSDSGDATGVVPSDDDTGTVPATPVDTSAPDRVVVPVAPMLQDSAAPDTPVLDEFYDAAGSDAQWTVAFADLDTLVATVRFGEPGVDNLPPAMAVALAGVWFAALGKSDQRNRLELVR